jgi:hypothetical protein
VKIGKGPRFGIGAILVLLGTKNIVDPRPYAPAGAMEQVSYYGVSVALVVLGIWFFVRGVRSRREDHPGRLANGRLAN